MTGVTAWPWPTGSSPVRAPDGSVVAVAALAVPDLTPGPAVVAVLADRLPVMGAAVLAQLGVRAQEVTGALLPMRVLERAQAVATLTALSDPPEGAGLLLTCPGFGVRTAHELLLAWADRPRAGCVLVQGAVPASHRAGALS